MGARNLAYMANIVIEEQANRNRLVSAPGVNLSACTQIQTIKETNTNKYRGFQTRSLVVTCGKFTCICKLHQGKFSTYPLITLYTYFMIN